MSTGLAPGASFAGYRIESLVGLVPCGSGPTASRRRASSRDHAHAVVLACGQDVGLDPTDEDRVRRLFGHVALEAAVTGGALGSTIAEAGKVEEQM
jgi:hypothetical protein